MSRALMPSFSSPAAPFVAPQLLPEAKASEQRRMSSKLNPFQIQPVQIHRAGADETLERRESPVVVLPRMFLKTELIGNRFRLC
jgi:hypothetical protein